VTIQVGTLDPVLGRSSVQIARQGWGEQKSQNGGANPALSGPATTSYHLWAVTPQAAAKLGTATKNDDLFHNSKVNIETSIAGLAALVKNNPPEWLTTGLHKIDADARQSSNALYQGTTSQAAEKPLIPGNMCENRPSVAKATTDSNGFTRGLKPPSPSELSFSAACSVVPQALHKEDWALAPDGDFSSIREINLARKLAPIYKQALNLREKLAVSNLDAAAKASLLFELDAKINQFQSAFKELLGLDLIAFTTKAENQPSFGGRGSSADETPRSVTPGEDFRVRIHTSRVTNEVPLNRVWLESRGGTPWKSELASGPSDPAAPVADSIFRVHAANNAEPTQPYFSRPSIEQPYYDLTQPEYRLRSFAPYPLAAWAEFTFDGLPIRIGQVVQTMQRIPIAGGVYEPLVVTPAIGLRIDPEARILPLDGSALPVRVTVHAQAAAEGTVTLNLPAGWRSEPAEAKFHLESAGDTEPILFSVTTDGAMTGAYTINAIVHATSNSQTPTLTPPTTLTYTTGWQSIGYPGLRPYNLYKPAQLKTRKIDVKLAPGLRIGYVMGTGDRVPEAIEGLGVAPHLLTAAELTTADLSAWNVIVIGIRAYSARPELAAAQPRLDEFVRRGGTLIVQYQSGNFPAPFPLSMGRMAERVVDETAPVKLLEPANFLLRWPNEIGAADFDGWVEERGHSFLDSWDASYTPLTETADPGQSPQRGGLLVAHPGKGTYIYLAYALYRQLPELVPGSYRLLANLLSAGQDNALPVDLTQTLRP
jgi:hypothetical protein